MALARFIKEPKAVELFDEIKFLLRGDKKNPLENVAQLYDAFKGEDGDIYLLEELLYRPLENLAPLTMVDEFYGIARDLCVGLASLHRRGRVHRDLKLDNCGIDYFGTAKIFDLGSVTSEGGTVKGTTLSRAPELFATGAKCTKASDVWAMGAVLFALRTGGDYPFVTRQQAQKRPRRERREPALTRWFATRHPTPKARIRSKSAFAWPSLMDRASWSPTCSSSTLPRGPLLHSARNGGAIICVPGSRRQHLKMQVTSKLRFRTRLDTCAPFCPVPQR
jgi:serine/threonine protein kinase